MNRQISSLMLPLLGLPHVAIICSGYVVSKRLFTEILGLETQAETHRAERNSHKLELVVQDHYIIELLSFL